MSSLSLNTQFALISLLVLINTSQAHARDCVRVSPTEVDCRGMTAGAQAGIGVGVLVFSTIVFTIVFIWQRRRRLRRRHVVYVSDPANAGSQPQVSQVQTQSIAYPAQTYDQQSSGRSQQNVPPFAPPNGPPPV